MSIEVLVQSIRELPSDREYTYVNSTNPGRIKVVEIRGPRGPIVVRRYRPAEGQNLAEAENVTISSNMLLRIASALAPDVPLNIDRVLGASYNTRAVLESLLAHCPQFYVCRPGRIQVYDSSTEILRGHKHLLWSSGAPHPIGMVQEIETNMVISELPSVNAVYEALVLPESPTELGVTEELRRRHAQVQVALVMIGDALGMKPYVAKNDQSITYQGQRLVERPFVVPELSRVPLLQAYSEAARAGSLIDCIWFRNGRFMPAVFEVEHSTGVTSGLTRMQGFSQKAPDIRTRYIIAAPDEDRERVLRECARPQFNDLRPAFLPYSGVDELHGLVQRRRLRGAVTDDFIEAFLERAA